ncbi:MAG: hypothetical protein RMY62_018210 [Nostoc sp. ZfuVER08]|uniref:Uncharacterized protein n=1 Tax=Nostoc punctiforme FACHB-252 TaxID=1357509 RepID=A0ABR8HKN3_NOSPU|nr:hypothetical protein [Nostoc punctiforme]MBD2616436.1 hypothetical protein [Nostoc punctiforme FACHB-252]MDZ8015700.1 hypothetical protein [Nostoc sp. ZfuVER08]
MLIKFNKTLKDQQPAPNTIFFDRISENTHECDRSPPTLMLSEPELQIFSLAWQ